MALSPLSFARSTDDSIVNQRQGYIQCTQEDNLDSTTAARTLRRHRAADVGSAITTELSRHAIHRWPPAGALHLPDGSRRAHCSPKCESSGSIVVDRNDCGGSRDQADRAWGRVEYTELSCKNVLAIGHLVCQVRHMSTLLRRKKTKRRRMPKWFRSTEENCLKSFRLPVGGREQSAGRVSSVAG